MHIQGSGTQYACLTLECAARRRLICELAHAEMLCDCRLAVAVGLREVIASSEPSARRLPSDGRGSGSPKAALVEDGRIDARRDPGHVLLGGASIPMNSPGSRPCTGRRPAAAAYRPRPIVRRATQFRAQPCARGTASRAGPFGLGRTRLPQVFGRCRGSSTQANSSECSAPPSSTSPGSHRASMRPSSMSGAFGNLFRGRCYGAFLLTARMTRSRSRTPMATAKPKSRNISA